MATAKNKNMDIWEKAEKTPIKYTKKVNIGRGFTAIDAQYCVMKMTEMFGPVGQGWGYDTQVHIRERIVVCEVSVWTENRENSFGPYVSLTPIANKKGQLDTDAAKKGITDALTKCLSHLGIGADVFLGKYDDNKYIQQLKMEEGDRIAEQFSVKELPDPDEEAAERAAERVVRATVGEDL